MKTQLPLNIKLSDTYSFDNFFSATNCQLTDVFKNILAHKESQFIYIWGSSGLGKSHLLTALCRYYIAQDVSAFYLSLKDRAQYSEKIVENLETVSVLAIDDINEVATDVTWQESLFHLYNRVRDQQNGHLIISGNTAPNNLNLSLNDLSSRLNWGLVFQMKILSDEEKVLALQQRAKNRGLVLSDDAASYLLTRCPRDLPHLFSFLDKLDLASLAAQRKLTIPFIKSVL